MRACASLAWAWPCRRYYLNGKDAYRLKLLLPLSPEQLAKQEEERQAMLLAQQGLAGLAEAPQGGTVPSTGAT